MSRELRDGQYPTASVFNWRTPLLYVGLSASGWLPVILMGTLCLAVLGGVGVYFARHGSPEGTVIGMMVAAAAAVTLADSQGYWMTEAWAGLFIGLSLTAYLWRAWIPAALLGVAALFLRELAAPYCAVCALLALKARRRREAGIWLAGMLLFGVYYAVHVSRVLGEIGPEDLPHDRPWVQFGGLAFWLATIKTNKALFVAPRMVLTVASVLMVAALWARTLPPHVRWTAVTYALFFAVVGQPFNDYWGFVAAFPYAVAMGYGPEGLETLFRQARAPRAGTSAREA
jgi:hypothetical protein